VMSKCPDAQYCENWYADAVAEVSSIITLDLSYIATETPVGSGNFTCMHGPTECDGNRQQLCVAYVTNNKVNPQTNRTFLYDFANCQSATRANIPQNGQTCAAQFGVDWTAVQQCFNDKSVSDVLFRKSIAKTMANKVTASCTVSVNHQIFCIHDGDWKQCAQGYQPQDLVDSICSLYTGTDKPAACSQRSSLLTF